MGNTEMQETQQETNELIITTITRPFFQLISDQDPGSRT